MKRFTVEVLQNGWDYTGYVFILADGIEQTAKDTITVTQGTD